MRQRDDDGLASSQSNGPLRADHRHEFAPGFNNDYDPKVKQFLCYHLPGPPVETVSLGTYRRCKNPSCDRFACTASAEGYSAFCCPACAQGKAHTTDCDRCIGGMRSRLVSVRSLMAGIYPNGVILWPDGSVTAYEPKSAHVEPTPSDEGAASGEANA
jgi:hypothetical protein